MIFWINAIFWAIIIIIGMYHSKPQRLTVGFIISVFVALETYIFFNHYISYLPIGKHILFYAIPLGIFLVSFFISFLVNKKDFDIFVSMSRYWYICTIITVCLTLPTVFLIYDWNSAKTEYETEMEEVFGEDWEDEIEEMEAERMYR